MRILRRWADRRQIHALRRAWKEIQAAVEPVFRQADDDEPPVPPVSREAESRFLPGFEVGQPPRTGGGVRVETDPVAENRFLALKTRTARRLPVLAQVAGRRDLEEEAMAAQRDMTELMNRVPTLSDARRMPAEERTSFAREWHVLYLFLTKLEGAMSGSPVDGVGLARAGSAQQMAAYRYPAPGRARWAWGRLVSTAVEAAILVGFVVLAAKVLGIGREDIRSAWSGRPANEAVQSVNGITGVGGVGVAQAPTGETEVTAPPAPASSSTTAPSPASSSKPVYASKFRMPRLVQPVIIRYGTVGVFVLFGAFVSGLLLIFAARSR
jgi:hypothetical protein